MVVVDPRKIGGTGVSFTLGCNVCTWEATFGPGQEAPFDNVENAGKARRVHCGANERMSGVSRCPGLKQGDDVPEVPQSVRSPPLSPPPPHLVLSRSDRVCSGPEEAARLLQARRWRLGEAAVVGRALPGGHCSHPLELGRRLQTQLLRLRQNVVSRRCLSRATPRGTCVRADPS